MWKKILWITGIILFLLVVIAAAAPWLFKDKLKSLAKNQLNEQINAKAGFTNASLSLFRNFPRLSLGLEQFFITGKEDFAADTLISAQRIDIALNIFSLFGKGPIEIKQVILQDPRIHAIVDKNGRKNWDIVKASEPSAADTAQDQTFQMNLSKYNINNGHLAYDDDQGNIHFSIDQLNHEGSGNFSEKEFRLNTSTVIGATNFSYGGIPYLVNTNISVDAAFDINTDESKYGFSKASAKLNAMKINADGYFQLLNDSTYSMDITFNTPSNDFRDILSLVPAIYQNDFSTLKTKGTAAFDGFVKGSYSPSSLPAYAVNVIIKDGYFKYPDLPQPVQDINLLLKASNVDGQPDNMVLEIPTATLRFGNDPFRLRVVYKQPNSAQYLDAEAKGKIDLGTIGQFVKLPEGTNIGGQINADLAAKGNLNVILQQKPGPFQANGLLQLTNVLYASKEFPQPIKNTSATIRVANPDGIPDHTSMDLTSGHTEIGNDMIDFSLLVTHPATDPEFNAGIKGGLALDRIKQWYNFETGTRLDGHMDADLKVSGKKSMIDHEKYEMVQASGRILIKDLLFTTKNYPQGLQISDAQLDVTPTVINITKASGSFQETQFTAKGKITNAIGYGMNDEPLSGNMQVNAGRINLNKWMGLPETRDATSNAQSLPFAVPANIRFALEATADEVSYDSVKYEQVKGILIISDETVTLQNLDMQALGGSIGLNGNYSTKTSKTKPAINLSYNMKNLDVEQTFKAYNTVKYLMPVGEFIAGKLNSTMQVTGKLGDGMMPDLPSLAGNGSVLLVEGFLSKFKPLEELAGKLNIRELQKISVKDIKQYFEFINGKVLVKPFKLKVSDIDMEIGGMHGFDQSLDYVINLKIPRSKMGTQANQLVNGLAAELSKKGLPVSLGETVSLKVNMGGTITKPNITYNLQQASASLANEMEEKVKNLAAEQKAKADTLLAEAKKAALDSLEMVKKQAIKDVQDLVREKISGTKDSSKSGGSGISTQKKAEEAAKGLLNDLLKKKKNPPDTTRKKD
ncbi:DUF748 domain-containing protein [Flavihumibacter fluvii]|uniref:DUF748 domain-containing protein n=1 Tax=Flavihumibacter fluvii TaxID=2838157 RepID=UPI001BDE7B46|nr:AsmA-like C-terminal region-containing protein [Flavihumibacter fluvii]ULQ54395.1 AsmA family protein [Flavihumibacter fluvii]